MAKDLNKIRQIKCSYFCMEYALDSSLKTYAGGLGILAGDYLKGAVRDGLPVTAVGIKWKQGYGEQFIGGDLRPYDAYKQNDYTGKLEDTGKEVEVTIRKRRVKVKIWRYIADGVNNLYLLDTDVDGNAGDDRWICGQLYGWFAEERLAQEIVLGVGGIRALEALGIETDVYHFNEGHAVFAGLELLSKRLKINPGLSFDEAVAEIKRKIVFTTHTPVKEGNESHSLDAMQYIGADCGFNRTQLKSLGGNPFNMTVAALRLSRKTNGVAKLHGETANKMWDKVDGRSEIIGITNAVYAPVWTDEAMAELAKGAELSGNEAVKKREALYERHMQNKRELIDFVEKRAGVKLREDVMLIGFSRRAAPYKRSNLIFRDERFIKNLFKNNKIQIIFSGKSHPLDDNGKNIVYDITKMTELYPNNVVFLENYDMEIGAALTRGCDIWLNNPVRPLEASGTSGMKAAMNGVINVSVLDGWWPELCIDGVNGWQFGDGVEFKSWQKSDIHDYRELKKVLVEKVIPTYYNNQDGWRVIMANSINGAKEKFEVARMLCEYYELLYND
ncbi:MAG: alpha-glucan family phosphorylase [Oscillospiraceae bacterium]|nr:alpha-glucan family phosphorylase [Oscillospiraceae bacterium]